MENLIEQFKTLLISLTALVTALLPQTVIEEPIEPIDPTQAVSAMAWIKTEDPLKRQGIVSKFDAGTDNREWWMFILDGHLAVEVSDNGLFRETADGIPGSSNYVGDYHMAQWTTKIENPDSGKVSTPITAEWTHVAFTFDRGDLHVYINGQEVDFELKDKISGQVYSVYDGEAEYVIGKRITTPMVEDEFVGEIKDVYAERRVFTHEEILEQL